MKIALINTPYLSIYGSAKRLVGSYFPLGLGYITAVLQRRGHEVILLDPESQGISLSNLRLKLRDFSPNIVGLSCTTPSFGNAQKIARMVKEETKATVVLGGVHASALPESVLTQHPEFDLVVIGEGEYTMLELCNNYQRGQRNLSSILGIAFRDHNKVHINPPRPLIENLDELPLPARDLVDLSKYTPQTFLNIGEKSASIITSRGCPFRCIFCASHVTMGRRYRLRSPETVVSEIEYLIKNYEVRYILIKDDTFTVNEERVKQICQLIIERKLNIKWHCMVRADTASFEMLNLMKKSGCVNILYGIESGDLNILKTLKKGITLEESEEALKISHRLGFKTVASFMFGSPGETKDSIRKTVEFAVEIDPTIAIFTVMVPYPGTEIYNKYVGSTYALSNDWEDFVYTAAKVAIKLKNLPPQELQKSVYRAYLRFYSRPLHLLKMLKSIQSLPEMKVYLKGGLGLLRWTINLSRSRG